MSFSVDRQPDETRGTPVDQTPWAGSPAMRHGGPAAAPGAWAAPLLRLTGRLLTSAAGRGKLIILIYHRTLPEPDPLLHDEIDAATFERHVALLASEFNVMRLGEACDGLRSGALPSRAISITFDDGYADNERTALPILKRYRVPATFFIATGYCAGGIMFNDGVIEAVRRAARGSYDLSSMGLGVYHLNGPSTRRAAIDALLRKLLYRPVEERAARVDQLAAALGTTLPRDLMMKPAQIRRLHDEGMEIGAHSVSHPILQLLDDDAAYTELCLSRDRLEDITGARVRLFAYPNGKPGQDYGLRDVRLVKKAGFAAAVSTVRGVASRASDLFQLPRVGPWDRSTHRLRARLLLDYLRPIRQAPREDGER